MSYIIADFVLVQLSHAADLVKSAPASHVCLNYVRAAQFYQSGNQNQMLS